MSPMLDSKSFNKETMLILRAKNSLFISSINRTLSKASLCQGQTETASNYKPPKAKNYLFISQLIGPSKASLCQGQTETASNYKPSKAKENSKGNI